ncbi:MAG TPA: hypothetical protein VMX38_17555 [Verrucomicrobiae bacterium]|jgi:hypothetical protein|nr:hypothetical protein [Verrucomicrobiae bacterium]
MSAIAELLALTRLRVLHWLALTALIVAIGTECFITKLAVLDPDIWWHLSTGDWIVHNHAFPHTGILSRTAANRPWTAYSWGYEVLLSRFYDQWTFVGMGVFGTLLTIGVALAVFVMLYRISGRFWVAWALSLLSFAGFLFNIAPRPVFFSVLLFALMLTLLFEAQRTANLRPLYWLPMIFLLWANVHIQFLYGIAVLGLFVGTNLFQRITARLRLHPDFIPTAKLPFLPLLLVFCGCVLISCVGPYSYHLYFKAVSYSQSKIMYKMISELQALSFSYYSQYVELLLAVGAFFALGWQKKIDPFKLVLLIFACIFAFRTWRDAWFLCVVAAAIIADFPVAEEKRDRSFGLTDWTAVSVASILLLLLAVRNTDFNTRGLDRAISHEFPVDAVNFLRRNPVGGPLYNSFDFGGFLIFYMPQYPVSIDGRTDLYGDAACEQYFQTQEADPSYTTDPVLNEAGVVVLKNKFPIATILVTDQRFRVIYRDNLATVFVRNW